MVYHDVENQNVETIIPCQDSVYKNVKIPIILISKEDGLKLKNAAQTEQISFILNMDWDEVKEDHLDIEYWINPTNLKSYQFLIDFQTSFQKFDKYADFQPKYKFKNLEYFYTEEV